MIKTYKNGNYYVIINQEDGTKYRYLPEGEAEYKPAFPETMDVNITNKCSNGCSFCYQNCTPEGRHCNFNRYTELIKKIHPYTELAINGNNLDHPQLQEFLTNCKANNIIVNMTVNIKDVVNNYRMVNRYMELGLINGLGISINSSKEDKDLLIDNIFMFSDKLRNNIVFHIINGLYDKKLIDDLRYYAQNCKLKILMLGYKYCGRGKNINIVKYVDIVRNGKNNLDYILKTADIVSFDNLAIKQLDLFNSDNKDIQEQIKTSYLGEDGFASMYLDLVEGYWTKSSYDKEFPRYAITTFTMKEDDPFQAMLHKVHLEKAKMKKEQDE